ncbi:DCD domain-containing protein NRP-B [Cicer arietinum]|uniref:B2 protein-like n=1 Tax=Cicer arietinum TaxID=3827 RepID=A0A1S2YF91_CICAR|nr:B2 protein-like [Cicer arietinum]
MENNNNQQSFWQFSDQLRVHTSNLANLSLNDSIWGNNYSSKRHDHQRRNFDIKVGGEINNNNNAVESLGKTPVSDYNDGWKQMNNNNNEGSLFSLHHNMLAGVGVNGGFNKGIYSKPSSYAANLNTNNFNINFKVGVKGETEIFHTPKNSKKNTNLNKKHGDNNNNNNNNNDANKNKDAKVGSDKRFKTLPPSESLPRNETIGGYIFVCNNDTMAENLKRELFGLPPRYRDSVRAITPGLPLFLYNYTTHQLHGVFEAASFGGTNIDPTAWEDKKCPGESRFPAQVRVITRKTCEPLEEDSFRPILHHYDGPKFRLELNVPEALSLLDIFAEEKDTFKDSLKAIQA